jgi:hypothetical protein
MKIAWAIIGFFLISFCGHTMPQAGTTGFDPISVEDTFSYVLGKFRTHDVVFLGTKHKQQRILEFIAELLPRLRDAGVTHLGLEVSSNQQANIDRYLTDGTGLDNIRLHYALDCPAYRNLFKTTLDLRQTYSLEAVALDLPPALYQSRFNRDEWMAQSIRKIFEEDREAKVLVVVGNLHILKKIAWKEYRPTQRASLRRYLVDSMPDLRAFSVSQCITGGNYECDFCKHLGDRDKPVAIDNNGMSCDWKLGVYGLLDASPLSACEVVDGVIVY